MKVSEQTKLTIKATAYSLLLCGSQFALAAGGVNLAKAESWVDSMSTGFYAVVAAAVLGYIVWQIAACMFFDKPIKEAGFAALKVVALGATVSLAPMLLTTGKELFS